jgi:hypothetical protein
MRLIANIAFLDAKPEGQALLRPRGAAQLLRCAARRADRCPTGWTFDDEHPDHLEITSPDVEG